MGLAVEPRGKARAQESNVWKRIGIIKCMEEKASAISTTNYPRQNFEELSSLLAFYPMKGTSFKRTNCGKSIYVTVLGAALTISCKQVTILCRHHLVWHHIWMVVTDSFLSLFLRQVIHALVRQESHGHVQHGDVHVLPQTGVVLVIQGSKDSNDLKGQLVRTRSYCKQWLYFTTLQ